MTYGISVIIPTKNNSATIRELISSIHSQSYQEFEIIVVDNFSSDHTQEIAIDLGAKVLVGGPERSSQRNLGASEAQFETILFLDSDMELTKEVLMSCVENIKLFDALCIKEFIVHQKSLWARARALERESYFHSLYFEAARCFRKKVFFDIGGYDPEIVGLEDMAVQALLLSKGYRIGWVDTTILHHEEFIGLPEYLAKRFKYGATDSSFASKFPDYWKVLLSPICRLKAIIGFVKSAGKISDMFLVWLLVTMRFAELLFRRTSSACQNKSKIKV